MTRLLPLTLLLLGCSGSGQHHWTPDPALTAAAIEASEDWCVATDGRYCPVVVAHGGLPIRLTSDTTDHEQDCGWIRLRGYGADIEPQWIAVSAPAVAAGLCQYGGAGLVGLLRHELGHAAGLVDVDDPTRIMHRTSACTGEISDADTCEIERIRQ